MRLIRSLASPPTWHHDLRFISLLCSVLKPLASCSLSSSWQRLTEKLSSPLKSCGASLRRWFVLRPMATGKRQRVPTFCYYWVPTRCYTSVLAVVRFTAHEDGYAKGVLQEVYDDDIESVVRMEREVEVALNCGIDVTIASRYELETFPVIHWLTTS